MGRGPKKHMKRLKAPKHWMVGKLGGVYTPRPRAGPHKLLESIPLNLLVRNRLQYALSGRELRMVFNQRFIKVDGRTRTDPKFPAGFMDVISIEKTGEKWRLLFDVKGRFALHPIKEAEKNIKVCRVAKQLYGPNRTPFISTNDGRVIQFPDPNINVSDSVVIDLETGAVKEWIRFKPGALACVTGGANTGRIGEIVNVERHPGSFDIVHLKDASDNKFATRFNNVFVIGAGATPVVSWLKQAGVRPATHVDREKKLASRK
jgi:small subunit ribosomal protein S4e